MSSKEPLLYKVAKVVDIEVDPNPLERSRFIIGAVVHWLEEQNNVEIVTATEVIEWLRQEMLQFPEYPESR